MPYRALWFAAITGLLILQRVHAADAMHPGAAANTPITADILDKDAFAQWDAGKESLPTDPSAERGPEWVIWTKTSKTGHNGLRFGESKTTGPRHLRIGFTKAIEVGSVLTRGNVQMSVLRADAVYPGDLSKDQQWIAAERVSLGSGATRSGGNEVAEVTTDQPVDQEINLWILPPGTKTTAIRFTHIAAAADPTYHGWLGGAMVFSERLLNLAPFASVAASADDKHASKLINAAHDDWNTWENLGERDPDLENRPIISKDHPEWLLLSWNQPVDLSGAMAVWCGFGAVEFQAYRGKNDVHSRDAAEADWETIKTASGFECGYPATLWPNYFPFEETVRTRALRLKLTDVSPVKHPHVQNRPAGGKRVWLGELLAVTNLGSAKLEAPKLEQKIAAPHAPIPISFDLPEAGYVTLVIEDATGKRVRNLVSETWFPAGENTAWWDGTHDLDRNLDAAEHGLYDIPARFVTPGEYTARGLWRKELKAFYEFSVYNSGNPPWSIPDHTGGWLANHSPPSAAVAIGATHSPTGQPAVFLGCFVTEGPDGFAWVDLDGTKRGGMKWIGGNWTSAPYLGRDESPTADPTTAAYVASVWETEKNSGKLELRISALNNVGEKSASKASNELKVEPVYKNVLADEPAAAADHMLEAVGGVTAYNGKVVCALRYSNRLLVIDARTGKQVHEAKVDQPRGIVFDRDGNLWVLSGNQVVKFAANADGKFGEPESVVKSELEDPWGITLDASGQIYVSDHGDSHQVKVFSSDGKLVRKIGEPGEPKAGPYNPLHMNHPAGIAIDADNQLWVTEHDYLPKRVSVWSLDGKFKQAVYGPAKYGGGGVLDPRDKTRFYYADEQRGSLEFELDWEKGTSQLKNVLYRQTPDSLPMPFRAAAPETAVYVEGRRYFTNCYNSSPTNGHDSALIFADVEGVAKPVAAMGLANDWDLLKTEAFCKLWADDADPDGNKWQHDRRNQMMYLWSDTSGDGLPQPAEIEMIHTPARGFTVMSDLSFCVAQVGDKAMRYRPTGFDPAGVPAYAIHKGEVLAEGVLSPQSTGGAQVLADASDEAVITLGVEPFHSQSICGVKAGKPVWSYPNPWPGLHASHHAAKPDAPGQLIGATRLMGGLVEPKGSDVGPLFALNANMGNFYLFTRDGLFVATVFADSRLGKAWKMAAAERGMSLDGLTLHDENFWPSINQSEDGQIYAVDGSHTCLLRLEGLETLRSIGRQSLTVSVKDLAAARAFVEDREVARQQAFGSGVLQADLLSETESKKIDGDLADWATAEWVEIDRRGDGANFNSNAKPYNVLGAIAANKTHLFAAWNTRDEKLLENSGELPTALFKTGGGLDLMLGTDAAAASERRDPVAGDLRLLVAKVDGKTKAMLYRAVVPGTAESDQVPFTSPVGSVKFDRVDDVSEFVELAADGKGNFEIAVPLEKLGLKPKAGLKLKGDIGVLLGEGFQTTSRSYWSNKATGITADVPSEARLSPRLWGTIEWKE